MTIRSEQPEDYAAIYELVKVAFETAAVTNGDEQNYVNRLRAGEAYLPDLALVAEDNGVLVGHIILSRTIIKGEEREFPTLHLGPISVVLERRCQGIGARLMAEALRRARTAGHPSVVLVGNPAYYHRFGFRTSTEFGIGNDLGIPEEYVMALELQPGALDEVSGTIAF